MINIARLYLVDTNGVFLLVDVPRHEARRKKRELERKGFILTHTEIV